VTEPEGLTAALMTLSQHTGRIAELDTREGAHWTDVTDALAKLRSRLTAVEGTITDQADILAALDGVDDRVAALVEQVAFLLPPEPLPGRYYPIHTITWWALKDDERASAIKRLRSWVEKIYRPGYGHLAAKLGECWAEHEFCLYTLDWLSEFWSVLYRQPDRRAGDLASQAEFQTRILPAAADQLHAETHKCRHSQASDPRNGHLVPPQAGPPPPFPPPLRRGRSA